MFEKANEDFDKGFELSPKNDYTIYYSRFWCYYEMSDLYNALKYFYQGKQLQPKETLIQSALLWNVSQCLAELGFPDISRKYLDEYFKQTKDSLIYFYQIAENERFIGNFKNAVIYDLKLHEIDTAKIASLYTLMRDQVVCRDYKSAYNCLLELEHKFSKTNRDFILEDIFLGYLYLKNGDREKADYYLKSLSKALLKDIESKGIDEQRLYNYWHLAKIYSVMGEKRKALDNLKMLKNRKSNYVWLGTYLKSYPFFDFIRDEPEFAEVLKDVEAKYRKEHERAGKLLKDNGEDVRD
jgi:tetratricopeptide (TPR) repeat protein